MFSKEFILQRICIFAGKDIDPRVDEQVTELLQRKFNIMLPQRSTMDEALAAAISDHEIIGLIIKYRSM